MKAKDDNRVIMVDNLSKSYRIWTEPSARLKAPLFDSATRFFPSDAPLRRWALEKAGNYYDDFFALQDISFEIGPGESVGVIGRNGSGKSTLLKVLAGILKPSDGAGFVNGKCAALLELGSGFNPEFTGRENIYLNGALWGLSDREIAKRYDRIVSFADIGKFIDQPVRTYSSGMFVRLAFAVAINVDPEILIVDEVLAVGDVFFRQKCLSYMREKMGGATRLMVSHDMQAIISLCSRVLVLDHGRLVFDGKPLEAVEYYTRSYHQERFKSKDGQERVIDADTPNMPNEHEPEWINVDPESVSGQGDIVIKQVAVAVAGIDDSGVVRPGDTVRVRLRISAAEEHGEVLFGYIVRDRVGLDIFGQNSLVDSGPLSIQAGTSDVQFEFVWPEIRPGKYFLTLGVGEGDDPIDHTVQCWVHNIKQFELICPERSIHCLFNNPISKLKLTGPPDA